jgi:hypothetical protein
MIRNLIIIIASLILVSFNSSNAEENKKSWCIDKNTYHRVGPYDVKNCKEVYQDFINISESLYDKLLKNPSPGLMPIGFSSANKEIFEKYHPIGVEAEKKNAQIKKLARKVELDKYTKQCEESFFKKGFKKGTTEFEVCLENEEKKVLLEQRKIATLPAAERYAYTCEKTYGFRKGTDNFKECVFKIMTTEYEMQNQLNQRRIAELERKVVSNQTSNTYQNEMLEIEMMKAKAMQDQVNFARNKDISDTLLGISQNLLATPSRPASNAPQIFNCQTRKLGGFDQIQCF